MPIQYTNRKDQTYYLHLGTTKTGQPSYTFSMESEGNLADAIPAGFEVLEKPNGQVYLRRIPPKIIADEETALVEKALKRFRHLRDCRVEVKKNAIIVHTPDQDDDVLAEILDIGPAARRPDVLRVLRRGMTYTPEMRFVLRDREARLFTIERYCYSGSIDDWIDVDGPAPLTKLVKYVKHLGKDSFFELWRFSGRIG
jgi:hypothetical protein